MRSTAIRATGETVVRARSRSRAPHVGGAADASEQCGGRTDRAPVGTWETRGRSRGRLQRREGGYGRLRLVGPRRPGRRARCRGEHRHRRVAARGLLPAGPARRRADRLPVRDRSPGQGLPGPGRTAGTLLAGRAAGHLAAVRTSCPVGRRRCASLRTRRRRACTSRANPPAPTGRPWPRRRPPGRRGPSSCAQAEAELARTHPERVAERARWQAEWRRRGAMHLPLMTRTELSAAPAAAGTEEPYWIDPGPAEPTVLSDFDPDDEESWEFPQSDETNGMCEVRPGPCPRRPVRPRRRRSPRWGSSGPPGAGSQARVCA